MKPIKLVSGYSSVSTPVGSGVVQAGGVTSAPAPSTSAGGWNKQRIDTFVTPAQATAPADPFSDPFNDRHATRTATALQLQPPAGVQPNPSAPGFNPSNPSINPQTPPNTAPPAPNFQPPTFPRPSLPGPSTPDVPPTLPRDFDPTRPPPSFNPTPPPETVPPPDNVPPPMPPMNEVDPRTPTPMPGGYDPPPRRSPNNFSPSNRDCDRIYNDLNCCTSADDCRKFMQRVMRDRLNTISLDIAPRFVPDDTTKTAEERAEDARDNEKQRSEATRFAGSRKWYRRNVSVADRATATPLAEGHLQDLRNGRAIILEESGQTRDIMLNDLSEDDLCFISGFWKLPAECAIASNRRIDMYARGWTPSTMNWTASAVCHKPLYFEQVQHERYGHSAGPIRQPFVDGVHFFGSALLLPYSMALDPPWECEYALGYYRPGSCAPWHIPPFPFSPRAALAQAGVVVGGIYIMP